MRDVRSWEKTGSGQRWGEPTRLTQNGSRALRPAAFLWLAVFPEIIGSFHLLREIIEDLRQRAAVAGCHGPSNLSTVPHDRAAGEYERKERHDLRLGLLGGVSAPVSGAKQHGTLPLFPS